MLQSAAAFTSPTLPMNPHTVCPKVCDALRVLHGSGHSVVSRARPTGCDSQHCLLSGSAVFVPVHGDAGCSACQASTSRCKAERGDSERQAVGDRKVNESPQRARQRPRMLVSAWSGRGVDRAPCFMIAHLRLPFHSTHLRAWLRDTHNNVCGHTSAWI